MSAPLKFSLLLVPWEIAVVLFGLGIWNVHGYQSEWLLTGVLAAFVGIPGAALVITDATS